MPASRKIPAARRPSKSAPAGAPTEAAINAAPSGLEPAIEVTPTEPATSQATKTARSRKAEGAKRALKPAASDAAPVLTAGHSAEVTPPPAAVVSARPKRTSKRKTTPVQPPAEPRWQSKQAMLIAMLQRGEGATIAELAAATGWQSHSVRGVISGALKKQLGLEVASELVQERGRVYRIPTRAAGKRR